VSLEPPARLHAPLMQDYDGEAADPGQAETVPEAGAARALRTAEVLAQRRGSGFTRFALWVFGSLFTLILSVSAWNFVTGLFLGWIAFVLLILALIIVLVISARELLAFSRMARLDRLRLTAAEARLTADLKAARAVTASLVNLYADRADTAWGRARLAEREAEMFDADALLSLAEVELLAPLDRAALAEVEAAAFGRCRNRAVCQPETDPPPVRDLWRAVRQHGQLPPDAPGVFRPAGGRGDCLGR